jgi:hypothetical protein
MSGGYVELTAEQRREVVNTRQVWEARDAAVKRRAGYAGSMAWRSPRGKGDYLYRIVGETGSGQRRERSLGPRSPETERVFREFQAGREVAKADLEAINERLQKQARLNRALDLGRVPTVTSRVLRRLHAENLLGGVIVVSGTNAIYAYEAAAGVHVGGDLLATGDLDIMLDARAKLKLTVEGEEPRRIIDVLKLADSSFKQHPEAHRAVNRDGFFVELIKPEPTPAWKAEREGLGDGDMRAAMIANMRWMANAPKFSAVAIGEDGFPVPIACADPRAFALYKNNMGTHDPARDPVKRRRDTLQAAVVARIVEEQMPALQFTPEQWKCFPAEVVARGADALDPFFG